MRKDSNLLLAKQLKVNGRKFALVEYQDMATMECGLTVKQQEKLVPIIAHSWAMK